MQKIFVSVLFLFSTLSTMSEAAFLPSKVVVGGDFTCALSPEGKVKCWGDNSDYQLGTGDNVPYGLLPGTMGLYLPTVNLGKGFVASELCSGEGFSCAASKTGQVKCWGTSTKGALGQGLSVGPTKDMGDALPYTDLGSGFKAKTLACGAYHVCALDSAGKGKCWGNNDKGQLGLGDVINRGNKSDQMGDHLAFLATKRPIKMISAGRNFSCALIDNEVKCWGSASRGQLGQQNRTDLADKPTTVNIDQIPAIAFEAPGVTIKIRKMMSGYSHSCILYEKNATDHVKCWGANQTELFYKGFLGVGTEKPWYGSDPDTMGASLPEVNLDMPKIVDIQPHGEFSCAQGPLGRVRCWGHGTQGELGLGERASRGASAIQMGKNLPFVDLGLPVKSLSSGSQSSHSCAILINSEMKCWGINRNGQLGYEDEIRRGTEPTDMGEQLLFVDLQDQG